MLRECTYVSEVGHRVVDEVEGLGSRERVCVELDMVSVLEGSTSTIVEDTVLIIRWVCSNSQVLSCWGCEGNLRRRVGQDSRAKKSQEGNRIRKHLEDKNQKSEQAYPTEIGSCERRVLLSEHKPHLYTVQE